MGENFRRITEAKPAPEPPTPVSILNINELKSHELDSNAKGIQLSVHTHIYKNDFVSPRVRALLDTGAMFSVMHQNVLKSLKEFGMEYELQPSKRSKPVSASNHILPVLGDVILNLQFKTDKEILKIRKVRFTVLHELSCPLHSMTEAFLCFVRC